MAKPKHFSRDDGAFTGTYTEGVDWIRDYGEMGVYVQKADDGLWEVRKNEYIPRVGTDDEEIDVLETKSDAMEVARDFVMNYQPEEGEVDYDGKQYVYEFYDGRFDSYSRDDIIEIIADYINRNYHIFTEYEDYDSGEIEDVEASVSSVGGGRVGLTTNRERGYIKKERFDMRDLELGLAIEEVIEEKDLMNHKTHRTIQETRVQGEPLPNKFEIEDEVLDKVAQRGADIVIRKMENKPHTRFFK